jgi:D-xylulose reductase
VVMVAIYEKDPEIEYNLVVRKGIKMLGSWGWGFDEFVQSLELIRSGKIDRKPLITHEYPLDKAKEAYETQLKAEEAIKVIIKP